MYDEIGITKRVLLAAKLLGITNVNLAKELGVRKQFIVALSTGASSIPAKRAIMFLYNHKDIDVKWLLFNEGQMMVMPSEDGNHKITMHNNGDMTFTADNRDTSEKYKEKNEQLRIILKEKERYIEQIEKTIENQDILFKKIMDKL